MADTKRILEHLAELYAMPTNTKTAEEVAALNLEKLNANYAKYDEAFSPYLTLDILKSIDSYWKFKNDKIRPTLAQILAGLNALDVEKEKPVVQVANEQPEEEPTWRTFWNVDPAMAYFMRDCETDLNAPALVFYRQALRDVIFEQVETLPNAKNMSYSDKIAIVRRNGWDGDLGERAKKYAGRKTVDWRM